MSSPLHFGYPQLLPSQPAHVPTHTTNSSFEKTLENNPKRRVRIGSAWQGHMACIQKLCAGSVLPKPHISRVHQVPKELLCLAMAAVLQELGHGCLKFNLDCQN